MSVSRVSHSFLSVGLYSYYISLVTCPVDFNSICEEIRPEETNILYFFLHLKLPLMRVCLSVVITVMCAQTSCVSVDGYGLHQLQIERSSYF
jgi:hypothetical protein